MDTLKRHLNENRQVLKEIYKLCPQCGNFEIYKERNNFCVICGHEYISECPSCSEPIIYPVNKYCPVCGKQLYYRE